MSAKISNSNISNQANSVLELNSEFNNSQNYSLICENGILQLAPNDKKKGGALFVDFASESMKFRRNSFVVTQDIAKAVGCKSGYRPKILDVTAGLGGDAFTLACIGCYITLIESNHIIYALLENGIKRANILESELESKAKLEIGKIVKEKLHLLEKQNALIFLNNLENANEFEVIYLDPMFPQRQKSAKVKKNMQYFHDIVGYDFDQEAQLLKLALEKAQKRVVVKRPKLAPFLADIKPTHQIKGKAIRFDIYLINNFKTCV